MKNLQKICIVQDPHSLNPGKWKSSGDFSLQKYLNQSIKAVKLLTHDYESKSSDCVAETKDKDLANLCRKGLTSSGNPKMPQSKPNLKCLWP